MHALVVSQLFLDLVVGHSDGHERVSQLLAKGHFGVFEMAEGIESSQLPVKRLRKDFCEYVGAGNTMARITL